jgi:hypothetical protein
MRRVRIMTVLSVLAVVALGGGGAALGARHGKRLCVRYMCRTLAATAQIRVFQATPRHPAIETFQSSFARWLPTGRVTPLGDHFEPEPGPSLGRLALAGQFAAYALVVYGKYNYEGTVWRMVRLNVKTGHREHAEDDRAEGSGSCLGGIDYLSPGITDVAVTPKGTTAWIIGDRPYSPYLRNPTPFPTTYAVCTVPPASRTVTRLATGFMIVPKSLAAILGHLYWIEGSTTRSAVIR